MKKKILVLCMTATMLVSTTFVGCGATADTSASGEENTTEETEATENEVVAEGVGYANWGYDFNLLLQEYADGTAKIYMTATMDEQPSIEVIFDGTITKGEDEDGDPCVTLNLDSATMYGDLENTGEASEMDGADWMDETEQITNTYDAETGAYTLTFGFSVYGYTTATADIEVAAVDSATDVDEWTAQYLE